MSLLQDATMNLYEARADGYDINIIKSMYDDINRKAFQNELPKNPPLSLTRSKVWGGRVVSVVVRKGGVADLSNPRTKLVQKLQISTFHEFEAKRLYAVIAHEMIHVKLHLSGEAFTKAGKVDGGHGSLFKKLMKEVGRKLGIEVPGTEFFADDLKISPTAKKKSFYIILFHKRLGNSVMSVGKKSFISEIDGHEGFKQRMATIASRNPDILKISVGISSDPKLEEFPLKRNARKISSYSYPSFTEKDMNISFSVTEKDMVIPT